MRVVVRWYGETLKKDVNKVSKAAVKLVSKSVADGIRIDLPEDTGDTKASVEIVEWEEKGKAVGAYVKTGVPGTTRGYENVAIAILALEVGSEKQAANPILRKNTKKNNGKFKKAMTNQL